MDENRSHRPGLTPEKAKAYTDMDDAERVEFHQREAQADAKLTEQARDRAQREASEKTREAADNNAAVCEFCGKIASLDDAVARGWVPYFYDTADIERSACCPSCVEVHLTQGADGEWLQRHTPLTTLSEMTVGRLIQLLMKFDEASVVKIEIDEVHDYGDVGEIHSITWKDKYFHNPVIIEIKR